MFPARTPRPRQPFGGARSGAGTAAHAASLMCSSSGLVWLCPMKIDRPAMKLNNFLALFRKKGLAPPAQIDVERRRHVFAFASPLQTFQLVHGAIKLTLQVSFVAEELVSRVGGR